MGRRLTRINAWLGSRGTVTPLHYDRHVAASAPRHLRLRANSLAARPSYDGALVDALRQGARACCASLADGATRVAGLLTQAVGFKYVRLYPASNTPFLYRTKVAWAQQRRWPDAAAQGDAAADDGQGTISLVDVEHPDLERFPLFQQARCMETVLVRNPAPAPRVAAQRLAGLAARQPSCIAEHVNPAPAPRVAAQRLAGSAVRQPSCLAEHVNILSSRMRPARRALAMLFSSPPAAGISSRASRCRQASASCSEPELAYWNQPPSLKLSLMSAYTKPNCTRRHSVSVGCGARACWAHLEAMQEPQ